MSEWKRCTLGDVITFQRGFDITQNGQTQGKIPVVSSSGIRSYNGVAAACGPGVVIGRKGTLGSVFYLPDDYWPHDTTLGVKDFKGNSPKFIYYYLHQFQFENYDVGSSNPTLNRNHIHTLQCAVPPLPEQRAIADVLSSLDDKIDLLRCQNKTLEAMAEALFRQWFIEEADEGWDEGSLLDLIDLIGGGTPKTEKNEYWDGNIPWLSGGDISANHRSIVLNSGKTISEEGINNSAAKILPQYATVITARGTVGKYCLLGTPMTFSQSNYGVLPKDKKSYFFAYLLINNTVEELQASAYGSVFDTITTSVFRGKKVPLPSWNEIDRFNSGVSRYFQKMISNVQQMNSLTSLRDTLLPKLMSGEVRVDMRANHA